MRVRIEAPNTGAIARFLAGRGIANAKRIAKFARPSFQIIARRTEMSSLGVGESRFDGDPDMPPDFVWPTFEGRNLQLLAQIDLSTLDAPELPPTGWLCFFYDSIEQRWGDNPKDSECYRVYWFDVPRESLVRVPHPPLADPEVVPSPCRLEFHARATLPWSDDELFRRRSLLSLGRRVRLVDQYDTHYQSALNEFHCGDANAGSGAVHHHMLGWPATIQGCLRLTCELAADGGYVGNLYEAPKKERQRFEQRSLDSDWIVLLQLSSCGDDGDSIEWQWADGGRLYFCIRRRDLEARRFDKTVMTFDSC